MAATAVAAPVVRIKDIATLRGVRGNQILGLGLVTGLNGKGDSSTSPLLRSSLSSLVASFGVTVAPQDVRSKNAAVVMVSAELPAFARAGDRIDVTVSSIGDARDLDGGILLQANLQAANGQTYAVAQGRVMTTSGSQRREDRRHHFRRAPSWRRKSSPSTSTTTSSPSSCAIPIS